MKTKTEEKVILKEEKDASKDKTQGGDSDQEMLNLENEIYSLTHYADDEEELVAQMFATIKGSKLEAMMPPILKEIPLIDVQQLCLHELRGMSQRRILSIINGQEMSGSSSDEQSDDNKKEDSNLAIKSMEGDEDPADLDNVNESNLTALDLLELEMRAKLIKTMLGKQEGDDDDEEKEIGTGFVPDIKIKEEPVTPESTRMEEDAAPSPKSTHKHRKKKYSRRRGRSDSRSYSSSYSSSSSRSRSNSSRSRSRSYSSDRKKRSSESPESKKPTKKKITKKEFEARMKKAKMNRSYRKRKDSEDDSGENKKKKKGKSKKGKEGAGSYSLKQTLIESNITPAEEEKLDEKKEEEIEEGAEGEGEGEDEEGEVTEKEEGEVDSNEEGACSSSDRSRKSRSRSRSYSSGSYSSYSSRGRSYSRSSKRRSRKKSKKSRRNKSSSPSSVPKIPNWKADKDQVEVVNSSEEASTKTLPSKEDRQSISFSINKKGAVPPIKTNPELNDDGAPIQTSTTDGDKTTQEAESPAPVEEEAVEIEVIPDTPSPAPVEDVVEEVPPVAQGKKKTKSEASTASSTPEPKLKIEPTSGKAKLEADAPTKDVKASEEESKMEEDVEPGEVVEDFYKGADELSFSEDEAECEEEDLEKFLHDDTPVEPIHIGEATLRKAVKVVSSKDEAPIASWESKKKKDRMKGDLVMDGVGFLKTVLSEGQNPPDSDSNNAPKEEDLAKEALLLLSLQDTAEESSQDVLETLPPEVEEANESQESHRLEIIGVIDPKDDKKDEPLDDELSGGGSSWSMRWLQSEKVQKVVSNSKMLSKVRKKIQAKGKGIARENPKIVIKPPAVEAKPDHQTAAPVEPKPQPAKPSSSSAVIGSIEEYEKLFGIKVKAPTSLPQAKAPPKPAPTLMFSDDDEDSEEEALWSTIMKK